MLYVAQHKKGRIKYGLSNVAFGILLTEKRETTEIANCAHPLKYNDYLLLLLLLLQDM